MSDEKGASDNGTDVERLALAILTLRVNTPPGEWLNDQDFDTYVALVKEADDEEGLLLSMMNLAWYALMYLADRAVGPQLSATEWLSKIALEIQAWDF